MKQHKLLNPKERGTRSKRLWVKDLVPIVSKPFECICFDIKYIYIQGRKRNAMLLTAIDCYSRLNMAHHLAFSVTQHDVEGLFNFILESFELPEQVVVRSDNGSQFTSKLVAGFLERNNVKHEFCLPATPEQNAFIEAYHSIVERAVCRRYEFKDLQNAKQVFEEFRTFYNFERIHKSIDNTSPVNYLNSKGFDLDEKEL